MLATTPVAPTAQPWLAKKKEVLKSVVARVVQAPDEARGKKTRLTKTTSAGSLPAILVAGTGDRTGKGESGKKAKSSGTLIIPKAAVQQIKKTRALYFLLVYLVPPLGFG